MAIFCGNCGAPLDGQVGFCGGCGARAGAASAGSPAVQSMLPARSAGGGGSALKIVLIAVGLLFVVGVLAIGAVYYTAHRYVKMAENATGIHAGDVIHSLSKAASRQAQAAREVKRDGCLLLSREEASAILGVEVIRVDGKPNERGDGEHCDFFIKPGSIQQNQDRLKQSVDAVHSDANSGSKAGTLPPGSLDMIKNMARASVEAARNGDAPYFGFTVERENGKILFIAFQGAGFLSGVSKVAGAEAAVPLGVGDQAAMGIGESQLCAVKGNSALTLDLAQVTSGRVKGIALAKTILSRL